MQRYLSPIVGSDKKFNFGRLFRGTAALVAMIGGVNSASPAIAEAERTAIFGDWGGKKAELEQSGLTIESILTTDVISNLSGGVKRQTVVEGNFDLTASLDTEKAKLWEGGTVFLYVLGNFGEAATGIVGDTQATSNIEAPETIKLYEAWYNQDFADGKLSLLVGLHDYNSEFNALEYAGSLRHSSFGIEPDISQVGPSIFPTAALATRVKIQPTEGVYLQAAAYDGVPGDPNNDRGTHVDLSSDDGLFWAGEWGVTSTEESSHASYFKIALGGWYSSTDFEDFGERVRTSNGGGYLIAEKSLWSPDGESAGLGGFFQLGFARPERNQIGRYVGAGLTYIGLVSGRDEDTLSFGVAHGRNSTQFVREIGEVDHSETAIELSYLAKVNGFISVMPDLQYVVNPGTTPSLDDALVASVRIEMAF